jgi:hypothetical protein
VVEHRGADFYRQRAEDMRRQAERAFSPHLRETYLRIALDWERMANETQAKQAKPGPSDNKSQDDSSGAIGA